MNTIQKIKELKKAGKKIGFTASCFDLLHAGHYIMLKDGKSQCDIFVIALHSDPTLNLDYRMKTDGKQKNKPIQSLEERQIQVEGCKYVDLIVHYNTENELLELLKEINPDIRVLGSDWEGKKYTGHELDIKIHWHNRNHNYSTSNLRKRVYEKEKQKYLNK